MFIDYNKDGFVNSSDENAARNITQVTLKFIKISANTPLAPAVRDAGDHGSTGCDIGGCDDRHVGQ